MEQMKSTPVLNPSVMDFIRSFMGRQEKPDLFSKQEQEKFDYFKTNFPEEYRAVQKEIAFGNMTEDERVNLVRKENEDKLRENGILPSA